MTFTSSISSRLRLTPSRAAAASQRAALVASSVPIIEQTSPSASSDHQLISTGNTTSESFKIKSSRQFRFSKKKQQQQQHFEEQATVLQLNNESEASSATATVVDGDAGEDTEHRNLPGPSSLFKGRFPYQLRSRTSSEASNFPPCVTSTTSSKEKDSNKSRKSSVGLLNLVNEKDKSVKKKNNSHGRSGDSSSGFHRSGGRGGGSFQTASVSNTTGSCASSRFVKFEFFNSS